MSEPGTKRIAKPEAPAPEVIAAARAVRDEELLRTASALKMAETLRGIAGELRGAAQGREPEEARLLLTEANQFDASANRNDAQGDMDVCD